MKLGHTNIDFASFLQTAPKKINDDFGCVFVTGYQGTGKTWFSVYLLVKKLLNRKIKTNIQSLNIPNRTIEKFTLIDDITDDIEEDVIYVIDEISKKYPKECKQDKKFYSWLMQSRKRRRVVIMITQEYVQIPPWLRGTCLYVYQTSKVWLFPIFKTCRGIARLSEECEWYIDNITDTYIYKRTKKISSYYDTMEPIPIL